ncbi:MAG: polymer-forming cytoskeletal protein [Chrysiogenetes bacterium]|nr:polymer-forming cytoskeletal protein [Chrysiogenetes bacterium]
MSKRDAPAVSGGQGNLNAILDRGTQYEGKLTFEGTVLINGQFSGEIFTKDHLIVGEHGQVSADIQAGSIQISGEVNGSIRAGTKVEILSTGRFRGELNVPPQCLKIEPGAILDGTVHMDQGGKQAQQPQPQEKAG